MRRKNLDNLGHPTTLLKYVWMIRTRPPVFFLMQVGSASNVMKYAHFQSPPDPVHRNLFSSLDKGLLFHSDLPIGRESVLTLGKGYVYNHRHD